MELKKFACAEFKPEIQQCVQLLGATSAIRRTRHDRGVTCKTRESDCGLDGNTHWILNVGGNEVEFFASIVLVLNHGDQVWGFWGPLTTADPH